MTEFVYDVVVLGGGSGGYAAALRSVELGKTVALIEQDKVGGTCLHRGCIPTKALLHVAEVADVTRHAPSLGVVSHVDQIDMRQALKYRDGVVAKKFKGLQGLIAARKITVVTGIGQLASGPAVTVGEDVYIGTDVILATGSYSRTLPGLSIGGRVITSDQALELDEVPGSVLVLGGGVIGVEFASLWRSLGAEITIIEALDRLLPAEDATSSKALARAFRKRGIKASLGVRFAKAEATESSVTLTLEDGTSHQADYLLVAVGRGPATDNIGCEEVGVTRKRGFIVTDSYLRTSVAHVWAVGDIVPGVQLAHRGFAQGILAAECIAGLQPTPVSDALVPKVTYSNPEVASVGVTEAEAIAAHGNDRVVAFEYNLAGNGKSEILGTSGVVKIVRLIDGPILGVHLVGERVGELITEGQLAVGWEAHPEDISPFLHAHPTQSEALGEAFLALAGKPLHSL